MRHRLFIISVSILLSCGPKSNNQQENTEESKSKADLNEVIKEANTIDKFIDTEYTYNDVTEKQLIIKNSLPKGGLKYIEPNGKEYRFAIFWTQVTNNTEGPVTIDIQFPADTFQLPSSPGNYVKFHIPAELMYEKKAPLFNYGLEDLNILLDNKLQQPSSLQKTINPNETLAFYVITLFKHGVDGVVRAGLSIEDDKIIYQVNELELAIGEVKNISLEALE